MTPGASLGSITLSGTAYPYFHSGSSTGVGVNGDRVYQNGSSSAFYPVTHNTPGSTTQGVSLAVETVENGNSNCGLYARGAASHSGTSSKGTGYMALLTGANANPKVELWRNGVLVATGATASGYAISGSKPAKITLQVIGDTVTFGIMNPLTNTVVTNDAYVDASPIAGSYYGFVVGWYGQVDNYEIGLAGTATWTRSTPLHLTGTIPGAAAVLTHAIKPGIRVPEATTARSIVVRADTAPSGGSYTVTLERWNNGSFVNNVGAVTLTTGVSVNSATGLAVALAGGDILRANVSASSGAADVLISVDCWS